MISTLLAEHPALARLGLVLAVVGCAVVAALLHRHGGRRLLAALAGLGLLGVLVLTLSPSSAPRYAFCTVQLNLPGAGLDSLANVALTVPLALFAGVLLRHPVRVLVAVSGLSALVELGQALVPALGRACDTDDWVANTLGAVVGGVLALVVLRTVPPRTPSPS